MHLVACREWSRIYREASVWCLPGYEGDDGVSTIPAARGIHLTQVHIVCQEDTINFGPDASNLPSMTVQYLYLQGPISSHCSCSDNYTHTTRAFHVLEPSRLAATRLLPSSSKGEQWLSACSLLLEHLRPQYDHHLIHPVPIHRFDFKHHVSTRRPISP
jgi:hypothetical protein